MSTLSQSDTTSTSVSVSTADVAQTLQSVTIELSVVIAHVARLGAQVPAIDPDALLVDLGVLVLFGVVGKISAMLCTDGEVWRIYEYRIADRPLSPSGPTPENPPLPAQVSPGTTLRVMVEKSPAVSQEEFDARCAARGWGYYSAPLTFAKGLTPRQYGVFANNGFAVERILHTVPEAPAQKTYATPATSTVPPKKGKP